MWKAYNTAGILIWFPFLHMLLSIQDPWALVPNITGGNSLAVHCSQSCDFEVQGWSIISILGGMKGLYFLEIHYHSLPIKVSGDCMNIEL